MGINARIMDKIVQKCGKDLQLRVLITELLKVESDRTPHYKEIYRKLIIDQSKEVENSENS